MKERECLFVENRGIERKRGKGEKEKGNDWRRLDKEEERERGKGRKRGRGRIRGATKGEEWREGGSRGPGFKRIGRIIYSIVYILSPHYKDDGVQALSSVIQQYSFQELEVVGDL